MTNNITVIIPTLGNRRDFLIQAIDSINRQSLPPLEIIIVNNGKEILHNVDYSKFSNFPISITNIVHKAGASQARNFGAAMARESLLAFLDDDDLWEPNYLEEMHREIVSSDAKCVISRIAKLEDGKVSNLFDATQYLTKRYFLLMNPGVTGSNVLIERNYFLTLGGYDCKLTTGEDGDLILKILDLGDEIASCGTTQSVMRFHDGERLTSHESLATGYKALYLKYRHRVGPRDSMYLIWRYKREEYRSGRRFTKLLSMLFWSGVIILIRRTPKSIYVMQK